MQKMGLSEAEIEESILEDPPIDAAEEERQLDGIQQLLIKTSSATKLYCECEFYDGNSK